jgi:hypothetical protein
MSRPRPFGSGPSEVPSWAIVQAMLTKERRPPQRWGWIKRLLKGDRP